MEAGVRHSPAPRAVFTVPWVAPCTTAARTAAGCSLSRPAAVPPFSSRRRNAAEVQGQLQAIDGASQRYRPFSETARVTDAESPPNAPAGSLWLLWPVLPLCPGGPRPAIWLSRLGAVRGAAPQPSRPWAPA